MAERYRKGSKERVTLFCTVNTAAKSYLDSLAGEFSIGYAIELLVKDHQRRQARRKSSIKPLAQFASPR